MNIGDRVKWCGESLATIKHINGDWITIVFDDTHTAMITNRNHLEEV